MLREQTAVFVLSSTERASQLLSKHTNIRRLREESQRGTGLEGSLSFGVKEMAKVSGADDERSRGRGARGGGCRGERARAHGSRGLREARKVYDAVIILSRYSFRNFTLIIATPY